jgi:phospho-N-acetylmuramoyl-pentapeptide-transferase
LTPIITKLLYRYHITRRAEYDPTLQGEARASKAGTPIMGGLIVVITILVITLVTNWDRQFTYVPIGVMVISAILGAADDLLNTFGGKRRSRGLSQTMRLMRVHQSWVMRIFLAITLPWVAFRRFASFFGSKPGRGVHVHEKLLLQFIAGAIAAWWIYFKLGPFWTTLWIPFDGQLSIGFLMIPLIILFVMFTANAVNIADGLDGLAGGSLIITFAALTLLSVVANLPHLAFLNATATGALLTYTYFNVKPARFQMGDVGSLGLGALLAIDTIALNRTLLLPLLGCIFYVETITVNVQIIARHLLGRRIFIMAPLHHHLEFSGWSEEKIVMRFWLIHGFFVLVALWISLS